MDYDCEKKNGKVGKAVKKNGKLKDKKNLNPKKKIIFIPNR